VRTTAFSGIRWQRHDQLDVLMPDLSTGLELIMPLVRYSLMLP
jgi:hypothetical protein